MAQTREGKQGDRGGEDIGEGETEQHQGLECGPDAEDPTSAEDVSEAVDQVEARKGADAVGRAQPAQAHRPLPQNVSCKNGEQGLIGKDEKIHDDGDKKGAQDGLVAAHITKAFDHEGPGRGCGGRCGRLSRWSDQEHVEERDGGDDGDGGITPGCAQNIDQDAAEKRPQNPGDVAGETFQEHGFYGLVFAHDVGHKRPAGGPVEGPADPEYDSTGLEVPEGDSVGPKECGKDEDGHLAGALRQQDEPKTTDAAGHRTGDETDNEEGNGTIESDKGDLPGRVGEFQNEPANDQHFHPSGLPPERVADQQVAKGWNAQRGEGAPKLGWCFSGSTHVRCAHDNGGLGRLKAVIKFRLKTCNILLPLFLCRC